MKRCQDAHPEGDALCRLPEGESHPHHTDGSLWWPNEDVLAELARRPAKIPERRGRSRSTATKGSTKLMREARGRMEGQTTDPSVWQGQVYETLRGFLGEHPDPFTTPEDLWPLLDDPAVDRKNMSAVVGRALREGLMVEVGSKRLRDTYRTRDGVEFKMNKIVPIYQRSTS